MHKGNAPFEKYLEHSEWNNLTQEIQEQSPGIWLHPNKNNIPRPEHWSGWRIKPKEIEFWLDGKSRIHERLKYIRLPKKWKKVLLSP